MARTLAQVDARLTTEIADRKAADAALAARIAALEQPAPTEPTGTVLPAGTSLATAIANVAPGGTLVLRGGTYEVPSMIVTAKSFGLVAYPGETPVITGAGRPDYLYFRGGPNLVRGITFKAGGGTYDDSMGSACVEADTGCHDLTVEGCTFLGHAAMSGRQQLLYVSSSVGPIAVTGCTFDGLQTRGSGVHCYHDPGPAGITVSGCTFRNFAYEAAVLVDQLASDVLVESNRIDNANIAIQYRKSLGAVIRNNTGTGNRIGLQVVSSTNLVQSGNAL